MNGAEAGRLCPSNVYPMQLRVTQGIMSEGGVSCGGYADGVEYNYVFFDELEKLNKICKAAAEYCGGTFILDTTKEFEVEIPEERFDFTDRPTYMKNCAREVTR